MAKTARPALISGSEFHLRRTAIGLDLETFSKAQNVTISVASKLQTGRSPVHHDIANYLQQVEDDVHDRIDAELIRIVGHLGAHPPQSGTSIKLKTSPPNNWAHGQGTWQVLVTRLRHLIHRQTGIKVILE